MCGVIAGTDRRLGYRSCKKAPPLTLCMQLWNYAVRKLSEEMVEDC